MADVENNRSNNVPPFLDPETKKFVPGNKAGGRTKGSRNKLGEAFLKALHDDFDKHGVKAIEQVREERPQDYLKVIASILPKELNVNQNVLGDLTDDELDIILDHARAVVSALGESGEGARSTPGPQSAGKLQTLQ